MNSAGESGPPSSIPAIAGSEWSAPIGIGIPGMPWESARSEMGEEENGNGEAP